MEFFSKKSLFLAKEFTKFVISGIVDLAKFTPKYYKEKSILLVRTDAIGDYILFRNFIEILKSSKNYRDYNLTLVGNTAWQDLGEKLDGQFVDNFIWINRRKFIINPLYRYKKLREISFYSYDLVVSPVYSRDFYVNDAIVKVVKAKEKIGSIGDLSNITKWQKKISDKYYTKLIPASDGILFEFYRNKEFFENFLGEEIKINRPFIHLDYTNDVELKLPKNYAVISIGAGANYRKWMIEGYVEVAQYLNQVHELDIILSGDKKCIYEATKFERLYKKDFINLVGKISLFNLLYVLKNAKVVVSNETSIPHMAVALDVPYVFVVASNGTLLGRFTPYPQEITQSCHAILHPKLYKYSYTEAISMFFNGKIFNINDITPSMVIDRISKVLEERKSN